MSDGNWHTLQEIKKVAGAGYSTPIVALKKLGALEVRPSGKGRALDYRLKGVTQATGKPTGGSSIVLTEKVIAAAYVTGVDVNAFITTAAESHAEAILLQARQALTRTIVSSN